MVDLLASHQDQNIELDLIFAPEHGYRSAGDTNLPDTTDPQTGLPVYSLYGPRKAPTPDMLNQIDIMIIDLQDVGVRFYTYAATMVYTLQACQAAGIPVILLDRPNPLGGAIVEGATLEAALANGGLTTLAPIPTRHGMTFGELAKLYNEMLDIHADLTVVPMTGWKREMLWTDTGLPWYSPSPALTTPEQADLYGSFGAMETLNIAVGRGLTDELAFHVFGAPWITAQNSDTLLRSLQTLGLPGLRFSGIQWTPSRGAFSGKLCHGFRIDVTDAARFEGFRSMIEVVSTMKKTLGASLKLGGATGSLGAHWLKDGLEQGIDPAALIKRSQNEMQSYLKLRSAALIY
jgi:uncharacterized protein YbbC (DUF1343 family)